MREMRRHDCLFVLPSFRAGGAEKVVISVLNALAESGRDVGLAVIDGCGELRATVAEGIPVYDLRISKTRYAPIHLIALIRRLCPYVVFSSLTRVSLLLLMVRFLLPGGVRIVVRQPSIASIEMRDLQPAWLYRLLIPGLLPTADAIISQSGTMTADLMVVLGKASHLVTTINNPAPVIDSSACLRMPSPYSGQPNFLSVGRLSAEKGPDILLKAFAQVARRVPSARLTILGDGPLLGESRQLAKNLGIDGKTAFSGYVADPWRFYVHADAVVLASRREGFPNVLVEALAAGVPVVATQCGGVSAEIVIEGQNGFVVPGEDPERLAEAMLRVLALRQSQSAAGIALTAQRFSSQQVFAAYDRVICKVRGDRRAQA